MVSNDPISSNSGTVRRADTFVPPAAGARSNNLGRRIPVTAIIGSLLDAKLRYLVEILPQIDNHELYFGIDTHLSRTYDKSRNLSLYLASAPSENSNGRT
jgi:hypothetical protein